MQVINDVREWRLYKCVMVNLAYSLVLFESSGCRYILT